jgi:hypothetical protein
VDVPGGRPASEMDRSAGVRHSGESRPDSGRTAVYGTLLGRSRLVVVDEF